jgi:hypothetical protein
VTIAFVSGAQNVNTGVTVSAFPAASAPSPGGPAPAWAAALLVGLALVGAALLTSRRRVRGT